jgi:WD40 repeat protein
LLDVDFSGGENGGWGGGGDLTVLGAGADKSIRLWDAVTGKCRHALRGHAEKVCAARFSPFENTRAASCSHDKTIKVWDLNKGFLRREHHVREQLQRGDVRRRRRGRRHRPLRRRREGVGRAKEAGERVRSDRSQSARAARHVRDRDGRTTEPSS